MLVNVLNICSDEELMAETDSVEDLTKITDQLSVEQIQKRKETEERRIALQKKILAVAKMAKYFHTLREESETGKKHDRQVNFSTAPSAAPQGLNPKWHATRRSSGQ